MYTIPRNPMEGASGNPFQNFPFLRTPKRIGPGVGFPIPTSPFDNTNGLSPQAAAQIIPQGQGNISPGGNDSGNLMAQVAALAAQAGGGQLNQAPGFAQMTNNPNLWIQRHPAAMGAGHVPQWVTDSLGNNTGTLGNEPSNSGTPSGGFHHFPPAPGIDPHAALNDIINAHRQSNGLPHMHPEELHARVTKLAHEIIGRRGGQLRPKLRGIQPPMTPPPNTYS